jgi:sugar phosphate isomerase/epimerase
VIDKKQVISLIPAKRANYGIDGHSFDFASMTIDDYKSLADYYNRLGEQAKKADLQLVYHNHNREFRPLKNGTTGYDQLIHSTDAKLLKLELDCGWMRAAGHNPFAYLTRYPERYRMLHIKDFKLIPKPSFGNNSEPKPTELGRGSIDYKPIFAAAKKSGIEWYFVEQEPPFGDMPAMQAIQVDYDYLHNLRVQ